MDGHNEWVCGKNFMPLLVVQRSLWVFINSVINLVWPRIVFQILYIIFIKICSIANFKVPKTLRHHFLYTHSRVSHWWTGLPVSIFCFKYFLFTLIFGFISSFIFDTNVADEKFITETYIQHTEITNIFIWLVFLYLESN